MSDRHGCYNRKPFKDTYGAPNGLKCIKLHDEMDYIIVQKRAQIKHTRSRDCRHPERATDPRCAGCKWITMTDEEVRAAQ